MHSYHVRSMLVHLDCCVQAINSDDDDDSEDDDDDDDDDDEDVDDGADGEPGCWCHVHSMPVHCVCCAGRRLRG